MRTEKAVSGAPDGAADLGRIPCGPETARHVRSVAFVVAIAMVSGINVFNAQKSDVLSDIALANVEALAEGEVIVGMPCMVVPNNYCLYIGQTPDQDFELPGAFYY